MTAMRQQRWYQKEEIKVGFEISVCFSLQYVASILVQNRLNLLLPPDLNPPESDPFPGVRPAEPGRGAEPGKG